MGETYMTADYKYVQKLFCSTLKGVDSISKLNCLLNPKKYLDMQAVCLNFNSKTSFYGNRTSCSHLQLIFETSQHTDGKNSNARLGDWGQ